MSTTAAGIAGGWQQQQQQAAAATPTYGAPTHKGHTGLPSAQRPRTARRRACPAACTTWVTPSLCPAPLTDVEPQ